MAFRDEVKADVETMHRDWARDDITRIHRVVTGRSVTGSTPTYTETTELITGVITVVDAAIAETVFGGMQDVDGVLMVLPAVTVEYRDLIVHPDSGDTFRVEEIRAEEVAGLEHQKFCRLVRIG